ncbi:MAG: glycosyltransferase family 39 protein [Clostridiaceae bacterium]
MKLETCFLKLENISKMVFLILFGIFLTILSIVSFLFTTYYGLDYAEHPLYEKDNFIFLLIIFILVILALFLFDKYYGIEKINTRILLFALMVYTLVLGVLWVFISSSVPNADQNTVSVIADQFCDNNFTALKYGGYLFIYPFQLGMVALLELIYRIAGKDSFLLFQFINTVFLCVSFYAIYRITAISFKKDKIINIFLILLFGCFQLIMFCTFVYGNIMSLMLSVISVWMQLKYFENNKIRYFIISAISIAFAIVIKSNSTIILFAIIIMFLLNFLKNRKLMQLVLPVVLVLISVIPGILLNTFYEKRSGMEINDGAPKLLWVAMGLQESERAPGWYNGYSYEPYVENKFDKEKTTNQAKEAIYSSLNNFKNNPVYAARFFCKKFVSQWNDPSFQDFWISRNPNKEYSETTNNMYYGKLHNISIGFMNTYHFIVIFSALCFVMLEWKRISTNQIFFALIVFGGFLFHMVWEAKGQYIVTYFVMIIPYAAAGINAILERIKSKRKKINDRQ